MAESLQILIALVPALLLVASLIVGRYPGERAIERIASARERTAAPRAPISIEPAPRAPRALLRTGELIARSLAVRPPPAHAAV